MWELKQGQCSGTGSMHLVSLHKKFSDNGTVVWTPKHMKSLLYNASEKSENNQLHNKQLKRECVQKVQKRDISMKNTCIDKLFSMMKTSMFFLA